MTPSGFIAYSGALAIAAVIPGPQIFAIVARGFSRGYRSAVWMVAGMVMGDILYLAAVLGGLTFLAQTFSYVLIVIKWAGVVYLFWLAVQYWRVGTEPDNYEFQVGDSGKAAFVSGILITLGNPKSVLFYISIMPSVIPVSTLTRRDGLILLAITGAILLAAQLPFAFAAARSRHLIESKRALRLLNRGASVSMAGAAVAIALRKQS